jgi:hypothetical protein
LSPFPVEVDQFITFVEMTLFVQITSLINFAFEKRELIEVDIPFPISKESFEAVFLLDLFEKKYLLAIHHSKICSKGRFLMHIFMILFLN